MDAAFLFLEPFFLPKGIDYAGNKEMEQTMVTGPGECFLPKGTGDDRNCKGQGVSCSCGLGVLLAERHWR